MTQPHQKVKTKGLPTPIALSMSLGYALGGGAGNQNLRQEKGYVCVSVWRGRVRVGLIEDQQKGPTYALGMVLGITMAGQGCGIRKPTKQLVIRAHLSSSESNREVSPL